MNRLFQRFSAAVVSVVEDAVSGVHFLFGLLESESWIRRIMAAMVMAIVVTLVVAATESVLTLVWLVVAVGLAVVFGQRSQRLWQGNMNEAEFSQRVAPVAWNCVWVVALTAVAFFSNVVFASWSEPQHYLGNILMVMMLVLVNVAIVTYMAFSHDRKIMGE